MENRRTETTWKLLFVGLIFLGTQIGVALGAISTCGENFVGLTGTFTSPNYPFSPNKPPKTAALMTPLSDHDENIVTCEWTIRVPDGMGIQLNFGDFHMAAGRDECEKGHLEVFSGIGEGKTSLDMYCGSDELDTVQLPAISATVVFRYPRDFSGKGFLVSYIATNPGETIGDFVTCADRGNDHVGVTSYSVLCPGGCASINVLEVWGDGFYRDNSHQCKAAVHAGVISDKFGGRINVKRLPGEVLYFGSEANGVTTANAGISDYLIQFVDPNEDCKDKLDIKGNQLTASSYWIPQDVSDVGKWKPDKGVLNGQEEAWSPRDPTKEQWLEVDLKRIQMITAINTSACGNTVYAAKSYRIAFKNSTTSPWTFYRETGTQHDKIFVGNSNIFQISRNNMVEPTIVGRFLRVYPTPTKLKIQRYSLKIALAGCPVDVSPTTTTSTTTTTTASTKISSTAQSTKEVTSQTNAAMTKVLLVANNESTTRPRTTINGSGIVEPIPPGGDDVTGKSKDDPGIKPPNVMNENSIIVIAIVTALAVTSILLAALVLILVRKRKKDPKSRSVATHVPTPHIVNNNNTQFQYKNKKRKKRGKKAGGEHFLNRDYKEISTTLQPQRTSMPAIYLMQNASTMPADRDRFLDNGQQNGTTTFMGGSRETDSFLTEEDEDYHEYQMINDEHVDSPVHSIQAGSSKASTGSSLGNRSRKSDTMQRMWGTNGEAWKKNSYPPNSPIFTMNNHQRSVHGPNGTQFASFAPTPASFSYPTNQTLPQNTRPGSFPHEVHYSVSSGKISEGGHPSIRKGSSQSPTRFQRNSGSSNTSAHSPPTCGGHPHDQSNPYYSSVPNGEGGTVTALNHKGYVLYGDPAIPEQGELGSNESRRKPSYKVPRTSAGPEPPILPVKESQGFPVGRSESILSEEYNGGPSLSRQHSSFARSDYDRLIRDNSVTSDSYNKNTFSLMNGSNSQYNQLNLNAAAV